MASSSQNFQSPNLSWAKSLLGGLVAQLHVVDAGRHARLVHGLDETVLEDVIVDQSAVADRAIQYF